MGAPFTFEQGQKLQQDGHITPETFAMAYPDAGVVPPMAPLPEPAPAAPVEPVDPDDARRQKQRELFAGHKASIEKSEIDGAERRVTEAAAEIERKRDNATKMGMSAKEIEANLKDDVANVDTLAADAAKRRANEIVPASMSTDALQKPPVTLASDTVNNQDGGGQIGVGDALRSAAGAMTSGYDMQARGIRDAAKAGQLKAAEELGAVERIRKEDDDRLKTMEAHEADRQAKMDQAMVDLQAVGAKATSGKVDPNRFWANKDTGDKVLAGIGFFLGSFGTNGNGNRAVATIQKAIDRDIDAQKVQIDQDKDQFKIQSGLYKDMVDKFKDKRTAEAATRVAYLDNAEMRVKEIAAKFKGQEVAANAQILLGELQIKKQEAQAAFIAKFAASLPVGPDANPEAMKPEQRERYVPGYGLALTKEDASKLKEDVGTANTTKSGIKDLLRIADIDGKAFSPDLRAEAQTVASTLRGSLRTFLVGPGAVTESENKLLDTIIADPTKLTSLDSSSRTVLKTLMRRVDGALAAKVSAFGLTGQNERVGFTTAKK